MKVAEIEKFEQVNGQLEAIFEEVGALSKKTPNDGVNKFKLQIINKLLAEANTILAKKYYPIDGFSQFDTEALPSNSDVVFICAQYLACLEQLRADNIVNDYGGWYWAQNGKASNMRTKPPKKISE